MSLPSLLSIASIQARLQQIFPAGLDMRLNLVREMAAKTLYVFLYGGMIEGSGRCLRPSHVYFFTEEQAESLTDSDREHWLAHSLKSGFRPAGKRWYADTTREPIRDETIRYGFLGIGAVDKLPGVPVTASTPVYFLKAEFAALFDPTLTGEALDETVQMWQKKHLTPAARARMVLIAAGKTKSSDAVEVTCPDGSRAKLSPGPSSLITKAVVEQFAPLFLASPALLWLSESGAKVRHQDAKTAQALGLNIDAATVLPDVILANIGVGGHDTTLIFIEVVASDGPMNEARKAQLTDYVKASGFPLEQCYFGTAFEDRTDSAFRKTMAQLAWGSFAWFRAEPERLVVMFDRPFDLGKLSQVPKAH